jgi:hypothetical protein
LSSAKGSIETRSTQPCAQQLLGRGRNTSKGCGRCTRLDRDTLQQVTEKRETLSRERLLTHEVFVADIQTALHEIATLSADTQLRLQSLQIRFLL